MVLLYLVPSSRAGARRRPGRPGRVALWLAAVHVVLLFFPPIPPDVKGSLWSYLLAALVVVFGALEARAARTHLLTAWSALAPRDRWAVGTGAAAFLLVTGLALRSLFPETFVRWSDDEGVYQPLTMLAYLASAFVLAGVARESSTEPARHLRLVAAGFVFLFLEEIDYLGAFGGLIGRVDGVYVGSLHDLVNLGLAGGLGTVGAGILAAAAAGAANAAYRRGYLQPRRLLGLLVPPTGAWLLLGATAVLAGQLMDVGRLGFGGELATLEELFEVVGATFWLGFALETATRAYGELPAGATDHLPAPLVRLWRPLARLARRNRASGVD